MQYLVEGAIYGDNADMQILSCHFLNIARGTFTMVIM